MSVLGIRTPIKRATGAFLATVMILGTLILGATAALAANPLTISMSASPSPVANGQELTYTIQVTNTGGAKVTEVYLVDQINGLTGVDGTNNLVLFSTVGSCSQTGNQVRCDAPTLNGFQSWTVTIRGVVTAANGTTLFNEAGVTGTKSAQTFTTFANTSTQVTGNAGQNLADLKVSVNAPSQTPLGSDFLYTLTVDNVGKVKASDITLTATLPSSLTFVVVNATSLFTCGAPVDGTITCQGGALNAGSNATIQIGVTAPNSEQSITLSSAVDPYNTIDESNDLNNDGQATTLVTNAPPPSGLALTKTDSPDPVTPSGTCPGAVPCPPLEYTITLTNTSGFRADYITVVDTVQGLEAASVAASATMSGSSVPMTCTVTAPTVSCETTRFQPGAVSVITISGKVQPDTSPGTTIINTATVNGNIKNKGVTNTATTLTTVRPYVDLSVTQHRTLPAPPLPVRGADRFDYTITVGNSGLYDANNVVAREPLPAGVIFDTGTLSPDLEPGFDSSVAGTTCSVDAANVLTCIIPAVQGANSSGNIQGDTETIVLFLIAPQRIAGNYEGPISSTVTVDPANAIFETDESNNTYLTTTAVETGVDLKVEKIHSPHPVARNGTLKYTITLTNLGTQDADQIVVRDVLPEGAVFRQASDVIAGPVFGSEPSTHNFTCTYRSADNSVECVGGIIQGTYSGSITEPVHFAKIEIDVFAPDEPNDPNDPNNDSYHNEVRVDPYGQIPEKDETNNLFLLETVVLNGLNTPANGAYNELYIPEITDNFDPVATSGTLRYGLVVANSGSSDAYNVVVQAKLPAGAIFRSANDTGVGPGEFSCSHASGIVTCQNGTVKGDNGGGVVGTRGIAIEVFAPPVPEAAALLEAKVDPANAIGEADESNNTADETTQVISTAGAGDGVCPAGTCGVYNDLRVPVPPAPDGIIENFDPVAPNGTLEYTITVENGGSADAYNVSFRAMLPTGSQFRSANDSGLVQPSFSCTHSGGILTCTGARINAGASRQVVVRLFAPDVPDSYRLDVVVDPNNSIPEGHEGNNSAEELTDVALGGGGTFIDLQITKSDIQPDPITPGGTIEYKIEVSNAGTNDAFNVTVRDPLPENVTYLSAFGDGNFICQKSGGIVDCTGGHVKGSSTGGGVRTITIKVKAPLAHNVKVLNRAFVDPFNAIGEGNETNNTSAIVETDVMSKINLTVTNTPGSVSSGSAGTWSFTIKNEGTDPASDVFVRTDMPLSVIIQNVNPETGWQCQTIEHAEVNEIRCYSPTLAAGATATFNVDIFTTADSGKTVTSTTYADPDNTIVESDESPASNIAEGSTTA